MATTSKAVNMLEGLVREGSMKWLLSKRSFFREEFEEMGARTDWVSELSPMANMIVRRCSKILCIPVPLLQENFNLEASDLIKNPSGYARNFLEYCCFRALALSVQASGHLTDKKFRRLTFDVMLAWQNPEATNRTLVEGEEDLTVGLEAFSRIAPAIPILSNVIISENLFEALTMSTNGRLQFSIYDKYLNGLERAIKKMKSQSDSSLLSAVRQPRRENILEVDGTVTTQPVLEHVGASTWPGRLILTDHALYFESLRVVSYDKPKVYDLSEDLKQVVKPELTGPWGARLFDKAVLYKSTSLSEPVVIEFPELKGHHRRDYWLAIIREILFAHKFIDKFKLTGVERDEVLSKAVLGILRVQAIQDTCSFNSVRFETLLMFNLCDQLPGGDLILETLASIKAPEQVIAGNGMRSISALTMVSNLGIFLGTSSRDLSDRVGEIAVGEMGLLERAVKESRNSFKKAVTAQATVDGAKVVGIDTNLAVMKELLHPVIEVGKRVVSLAYWEDPMKSFAFNLISGFIIWRGWLGYALGALLILSMTLMLLTRFCNGGTVEVVKVAPPPPMNPMEQLLALQNAISQGEQVIQDINVALLKLRGLFLFIFPQASNKVAIALLAMALGIVLIPGKYILLLTFLEMFTRYSPLRRESTERWTRRMREWWFSIPAAPVALEREKDDKKKK